MVKNSKVSHESWTRKEIKRSSLNRNSEQRWIEGVDGMVCLPVEKAKNTLKARKASPAEHTEHLN